MGRLVSEKPGCFLHGPEENSGLAGFGPGAAERKRATARELMPARVGRVVVATKAAAERVDGVAINRNMVNLNNGGEGSNKQEVVINDDAE